MAFDYEPAFPLHSRINNGKQVTGTIHYGMSLYDWFAAMANEHDIASIQAMSEQPITREQARYTYAELMIVERNYRGNSIKDVTAPSLT
jgi:hypothetical protein